MRAGNAWPASSCSIRCDHTVGTNRSGASVSARRISSRTSRSVAPAHRLRRSERASRNASRSSRVAGGTGGSRIETATAQFDTSSSPAGRSEGSSGGSTARSSASSRRRRLGATSVTVNPSNQSSIAASSMTSIRALTALWLIRLLFPRALAGVREAVLVLPPAPIGRVPSGADLRRVPHTLPLIAIGATRPSEGFGLLARWLGGSTPQRAARTGCSASVGPSMDGKLEHSQEPRNG